MLPAYIAKVFAIGFPILLDNQFSYLTTGRLVQFSDKPPSCIHDLLPFCDIVFSWLSHLLSLKIVIVD